MGVIKLILALLVFAFWDAAFADWFVLFPKEIREKIEKQKKMESAVNDFKKAHFRVRRIVCPGFRLVTSDFEEISLSSVLGKKLVLFFFDGAYTWMSEKILKLIDSIIDNNTVAVAVDINESEFPLLGDLKHSLDLRNVYLTSDAYLVNKFRKKLGDVKLPFVVFVDRYGFIRFLSDDISADDTDLLKEEIKLALSRLS